MTNLLNLSEIKLSYVTDKISNIKIDSSEYNHYLFNLMQVYNLINNTPNVSIDDVAIPTSDQFKLGQKFKAICPKDFSKKYYFGNCCRCGLSIKYTSNSNCITCRQKQRKYELYTSAKDRCYNPSVLITAKIYCIIQYDNNEKIYAGSTHYALQERKSSHKGASIKHPKLFLYSYILANGGWNNFYFKTIYEYPVGTTINKQDKDQLHLIESAYINDLKPICNQLIPMTLKSIRAKKTYKKMCVNLNKIEQTYKELTNFK